MTSSCGDKLEHEGVNLPTRDQVAAMVDPYIDDDGSHVSHMRWQIALERADKILALIQPLSQGSSNVIR